MSVITAHLLTLAVVLAILGVDYAWAVVVGSLLAELTAGLARTRGSDT